MAMVVLQPKPGGRAGDHPGPGAVRSDLEGNPDLVARAAADPHRQELTAHVRVRGIARDQLAIEALAAERLQPREEDRLRRGRRPRHAGGGGGGEQEQKGDLAHDRS
jgi:hypothetical protein